MPDDLLEYVASTTYKGRFHGFAAQFSIFAPRAWSPARVRKEFRSWTQALAEPESDDLDEESDQEASSSAPARGFAVKLVSWDHGRAKKYATETDDPDTLLRAMRRVLDASDLDVAKR